MGSTSDLLSVHQFIKQLKEENNGNLEKYKRFKITTKKSISGEISNDVIPVSESPIQKYIHGDLFEYSVQKAASNQCQKEDPWLKFKDLYPKIKPKERKLYSNYMNDAGKTAWDIFQRNVRKIYGRKSKSIRYSFGHHIKNYHIFPFLTKKLEADVFVSSSPFVVCDIKYSTMKRETYEEDYLVHALIQVLIYSLALDLDPSTLYLKVLVFYSSTSEVVLYETDLHEHIVIVNALSKRLKLRKVEPMKTGRCLKEERYDVVQKESVKKVGRNSKTTTDKSKKVNNKDNSAEIYRNRCEFTDDEDEESYRYSLPEDK